MAGYSDAQIRDALAQRVNDLFKARCQLERIRRIAADHQTCECSAALMILEVLDRG